MTDAVDPGMLAFYKELSERTPAESSSWPLDRQRAAWDDLCRQFRAPRPASILAHDHDVGGIKVRVFSPRKQGVRPGVIYFHGGGWVLGSPETHDDMCAEMAEGAGCVVALVDYRLAPENPHPAQLQDSLKVLAWMRSQANALGIDAGNILAAGDSAGGQMSVGLALALKEQGLPQLKGMILIYPVLGADVLTASYVRNAHAPCLTKEEMEFYLTSFLGPRGGRNWTDEKAVPNLARDISGLPPAFITVAAHDPLHDDGVIFHDKMKAAGIPSQLRREPVLAHSYMRARNVSKPAMEGFKAIVEAIRFLAWKSGLPG
jgi:acetyl esterase